MSSSATAPISISGSTRTPRVSIPTEPPAANEVVVTIVTTTIIVTTTVKHNEPPSTTTTMYTNKVEERLPNTVQNGITNGSGADGQNGITGSNGHEQNVNAGIPIRGAHGAARS